MEPALTEQCAATAVQPSGVTCIGCLFGTSLLQRYFLVSESLSAVESLLVVFHAAELAWLLPVDDGCKACMLFGMGCCTIHWLSPTGSGSGLKLPYTKPYKNSAATSCCSTLEAAVSRIHVCPHFAKVGNGDTDQV
jgi:hypothetical protein